MIFVSQKKTNWDLKLTKKRRTHYESLSQVRVTKTRKILFGGLYWPRGLTKLTYVCISFLHLCMLQFWFSIELIIKSVRKRKRLPFWLGVFPLHLIGPGVPSYRFYNSRSRRKSVWYDERWWMGFQTLLLTIVMNSFVFLLSKKEKVWIEPLDLVEDSKRLELNILDGV